MISHPQQATKLVEQHMSEFIREVAGEDLGGAQGHAAKNFALLYVGGRIGIEAGLLPWNPEILKDRLVGVFRRSVVGVNHTNPSLLNVARKTLEAKVRHLTFPEHDSIQKGDESLRFKEHMKGRTMLSVRAKTFGRWFADGPRLNMILEALADAGILRLPSSRKPRSSTNIDWAVRNIGWSHGKKVRTITFVDPSEWPARKPTSRNIPNARKSLPLLKRR